MATAKFDDERRRRDRVGEREKWHRSVFVLFEQGGVEAAYYGSPRVAAEEGLHDQRCRRRQECVREREKQCGRMLMLFGQEAQAPGTLRKPAGSSQRRRTRILQV
jgi:hypothetical protein